MSQAYQRAVPYINSGTIAAPVWLQFKKSTAATIAMNAETEDFDYISDKNKTTEIKAYAPTLPQDMKILKGDPAYDYINGLMKTLPTGADAHKEILYVFYEDVTGSDYSAWKADSVLKFTDYNPTEGKINIDIGFAGTITNGTVAYTGDVPSFSPSA